MSALRVDARRLRARRVFDQVTDERRLGGLLKSSVDAFQYGGGDFATASLFLRRVVPGADADGRSLPVSLLPGLRATAMLIATLPRLSVSLSDSPPGERLRRHFGDRIWGIRHSRIAQGVLELPEEHGAYLRGRSRQAVRTSVRKALAAAIVCRPLDSIEERRAVAGHVVPGMAEWEDDLFMLPGDLWRAAFAPTGVPVAVAQVTVDREWALLKVLVSSDHASRYLLHTDLVNVLVGANARYLLVDGPMAPLLAPALQYWQRLLGYRVASLSVRRKPLPAQACLPEVALSRPARDSYAGALG
jgi:hypothetical protein